MGVLLLAVVILTLVLVFSKPEPLTIIEPFDTSKYEATIKAHEDTILKLQSRTIELKDLLKVSNSKIDSLEIEKDQIKQEYEKTYNFINNDADINELDSIIRSNI